MSGRDAILAKVRKAQQGTGATEDERRRAVAERLATAPAGVIPARGRLAKAERVDLFCTMARQLLASVERVAAPEDVPAAIAAYLRNANLPAGFRMGDDPRLEALPWDQERALDIRRGPSDGTDQVGLSHARSGIAETGTLLLTSGPDNPTTINFLPDHHLVVVEADDIESDFEAALGRLRTAYGKGTMPRTVNFISGPSRSGDIEQKLILGAHGPRALHIVVVDR